MELAYFKLFEESSTTEVSAFVEIVGPVVAGIARYRECTVSSTVATQA